MEETAERQYRLRDTVFAVRYAFETKEAADQEYRLRDTVFAVRYALRSKKQLIKTIC